MTKFLKAILGVGVAALLSVTALSNALGQEVTLKLHQFLPAQANVPKLILDVWADKIEKDSGGRIKVERYPSMQLGGKPPELIDQAIDGIADVVWTVVGSTPGRFPSTEVFEMPFMMTNAEAVSRAYWIMFEKHMKDTEFKDVHILGTWVHGAGLLHTSKPVIKIEDLNGMKIRGGSRTINNLLARFGATPVGMPISYVPESLSKGVIDGTTTPWEVTASLKVPELVKNHTEFSGKALYSLTFVLAMNKPRYEGLPDDLKKVIDDNSGLEFSAFAGKTQEASDGPSRDAAVAVGNNIIMLTNEQVAEWQAKAAPIIDEWIAEVTAKGIDGKALVEEARALIAANTK